MKILRIICNIFLFIAVSISISLVQVGLFNMTAIQSKDIQEIKISSSQDSEISYFDNYVFWAEDIGENLKQPAKYRIRNWFNWKWWKKGMGWADSALDTTIAIIKPIIVPIAQVNAINNYYGYDLDDFYEYLMEYYENDTELNNALYEVYVIFNRGYGETILSFGENREDIGFYNYTGEINKLSEDFNFEIEYARWVKRNGKLYNTIWKLNKYNGEDYNKYFKKFITHDVVDGEFVNRHIKTPVVVLYYQQFVSLILSLAFVIKYPISFVTGRYIGRKNTEKEM